MTSSPPFSPGAHGPTFAAGPTGEPVPVALPSPCDETDELDYKHITQVSQVAGDAFSSPLSEQLPFNPSEYGLVHLPPLPCKDHNSDAHSEASGPNSSRYSTAPSTQNSLEPPEPTSESTTVPSSPGPGRYRSLGTDSESQVNSVSSRSSSSQSSSMPLVTMRYQHMEDENGNHLVIGREGQLTSCEDEV